MVVIDRHDGDAHMARGARIYLAGHTGLVGGAVLRALQARGYGRLLLRTHAALDLTDQAQTRTFFTQERPEVVILAAARVGGILANVEHPYEFARDNLAIELNVIHEAFVSGVKRFILLGSSCIYPKLAPQPLKEEYLLTGPLEETNQPYAVAKIAGAELCRCLRAGYGLQYLTLMPCNLYGPGDKFDLRTSHVLPALIHRFHEAKQGGGPVTLWGTGAPRREMLFVDDLADAVCLLLEQQDWGAIPDGLLNVGAGDDHTIVELAALVAETIGYDGAVEWDHSKPDGTPQKLLDSSRIRAMGWRPRTSLAVGISRTYEWFLQHRA